MRVHEVYRLTDRFGNMYAGQLTSLEDGHVGLVHVIGGPGRTMYERLFDINDVKAIKPDPCSLEEHLQNYYALTALSRTNQKHDTRTVYVN